jgi:hypothetical protein
MDGRRLVKLILLALIAGALVPATASAYGGWYCGSLKGSGNWCGWPSGAHTWEYNAAQYRGSTVVPVCQRLWDQHNNSAYGNTCGNNFTERHYWPNRTWGAHVAQMSGYNHTVWGFATTNRCDVIWCGTPAFTNRTQRSRGAQASPGTEAAFGVFRRAAASEDVPRVGPSRSQLRGRAVDEFGADARGARKARLDSRHGVFLVPGREALCITLVFGLEATTTCANLGRAVGGGLIGSAADPDGEALVFGAVPNGVETVELRLAGGGSIDVRVEDNAYITSISEAPSTVAYESASGTVTSEVPFVRAG